MFFFFFTQMDAIDASGLVIPVSVWVRKLDMEEARCLVIMEPVERSTAEVTFDSSVREELPL